MLLDIFKEVYNLPQDSEFKRLKLEDALIDKFGNLQYSKFEGWINRQTGDTYPSRYGVALDIPKSVGSLYSYGTNYSTESAEQALLVLFIKYGEEPKENAEEYYTQNYYKEFHDIVNRVYKDAIKR